MFDNKNISSLKEKLSHTRSVLILLPPNPDSKIAFSAISLLLTLKQAGKQVQLGCSDISNLQNKEIPHLKEIKSSVGTKNLIVNFKYQEKNLDKVDYDIDDQGNFSLLIKPKKGALPPNTSHIEYSYSGANADLVFTVGINSLEELGQLYSEEKIYLDKVDIVSINHTNKPASFANFDFHQHSLSGITETTAALISQLELRLTEEVATLLISRIYFETNNLTSNSISANTMKTLSYLMSHGGKFSSSLVPPLPPQTVSAPVFSSISSNSDISLFASEEPPQQSPEIPPEWKKPKIYHSSSKQKKS